MKKLNLYYWWYSFNRAQKKKDIKGEAQVRHTHNQVSFICCPCIYFFCLEFVSGSPYCTNEIQTDFELFAGSNYLAFILKLALELFLISEYICTFIASAISPPPTFPPPTFLQNQFKVTAASSSSVDLRQYCENISKFVANRFKTICKVPNYQHHQQHLHHNICTFSQCIYLFK